MVCPCRVAKWESLPLIVLVKISPFMEKMKTCNQCQRQMYSVSWDLEQDGIRVCDNPECPNYGLLQVTQERMAVHNA